jgi:hypothetical protein
VTTARGAAAMVLMLAGIAGAVAQPAVPPNELPGRERERFIDKPQERFMRPGPFLLPPVVEEPRPPRKPQRRTRPSPKKP